MIVESTAAGVAAAAASQVLWTYVRHVDVVILELSLTGVGPDSLVNSVRTLILGPHIPKLPPAAKSPVSSEMYLLMTSCSSMSAHHVRPCKNRRSCNKLDSFLGEVSAKNP